MTPMFLPSLIIVTLLIVLTVLTVPILRVEAFPTLMISSHLTPVTALLLGRISESVRNTDKLDNIDTTDRLDTV